MTFFTVKKLGKTNDYWWSSTILLKKIVANRFSVFFCPMYKAVLATLFFNYFIILSWFKDFPGQDRVDTKPFVETLGAWWEKTLDDAHNLPEYSFYQQACFWVVNEN